MKMPRVSKGFRLAWPRHQCVGMLKAKFFFHYQSSHTLEYKLKIDRMKRVDLLVLPGSAKDACHAFIVLYELSQLLIIYQWEYHVSVI